MFRVFSDKLNQKTYNLLINWRNLFQIQLSSIRKKIEKETITIKREENKGRFALTTSAIKWPTD